MKWGTVFSSTTCPDPARAIALAEAAEQAGFDSMWAPEHIVIPVDYEPIYRASDSGKLDRLASRGGVPDPLIWLAFVASRTTTIKLGTNVVILPEHETVSFAKACATLASLSEGRFLLGTGIGWCKEEYEAVHQPWEGRAERYEEQIEALKALWRDDQAAFSGNHVSFAAVECDPKPPGGRIEFHIGGTAPNAARRAGRIGDGYFPAIFPVENVRAELPKLLGWMREGAEQVGRDPGEVEVTCGGARDVEGTKWFAELGVHRMTMAARSKTPEAIREELLRFGEEVIEPTRDL